MDSYLIEQSPHPDLQASVLDVDCTGRFVFLAGSKELAVIDLESPYDKAYFEAVDAPEASILQCHPTDASKLALVRSSVCEVYSWSSTESRLTLETSLQGCIRPINSFDWCPMQPNVLATTSSEQFRSITVWDLRDPARLVKNIELFSSTNLIRWDPFREHNFASADDFTVQFWDLRSNVPERHLSTQPSRALAMAWSPIHIDEFVLSTMDGSLRIWHRNDFDNALLVGNYKKVPMSYLRYTPQGLGIASLPQRTRWTSSGLIVWRSDTLSPMRLVPSKNADDDGASVGYRSGSVISEESCVLGFGWCRPELPVTSNFNETALDSEELENLRDLTRPANIVSWSRDHQLKVHKLATDFLHVDGVKPPSSRGPLRLMSSEFIEKDSVTTNSLQLSSPSITNANGIANKRISLEQTEPQTSKIDPPAFPFVTHELSLLSSSIGQYRIEDFHRDGTDCIVRLTLYYCRRHHYHHRTVCGFDARIETTKSRNLSDSLPLADLDSLFQSTTTASSADVISITQPTQSVTTGSARALESLPSAGNVTLIARFPPPYPAPYCPPTFSFVASEPIVPDLTLAHMLKDIQRTADNSVSASRGCLEPCIRNAFKHLNSTNLSFSSDEESNLNKDETTLASSVPCVTFAQENSDLQASDTAASANAGTTLQPPSHDAFVPFPRISGVRISHSGFMVTFGLHKPLLEIVEASSSVSLRSTRTPRSFQNYLQLTEGKEHLFRKAVDIVPAKQHVRLSHTGDQTALNPLKRSRSAEVLCFNAVSETMEDESSASLMTFESLDNASRRRHFSGKTPYETTSTASVRKAAIAFGTESSTMVNQRQQIRRTPYVCRLTPFPASLNIRKGSFDRIRSRGSPRAIISDLSSLISMSKYLTNYLLDIADPKHMCSHNLKVARATGRPDLIQFWSFVASLAGAKLRQPPFPPIVPPYASQSIGRSIFNTWLSHFLFLGDVQSLTMMGFVMAALDAQSSPPGLLLTAPLQAATPILKHPPHASFTYFGHRPPDAHKSFFRGTFPRHTQTSSGMPKYRKSKSTILPPDSSLLETLMTTDRADEYARIATTIRRAPGNPNIGNPTCNQELQRATDCKDYRNPIDQPTSCKRTRSNSCSADPLTCVEITTFDSSLRYPPNVIPCRNLSLAVDKVEVDASRSRQSSDAIENIALLQQYFRKQVLMDIGGVIREEPPKDVSYMSHVWLLSFKHVLQYTHFLNVYISLLSAWDLIMPRANFSTQWHNVLTWLHARERPNFYHLGLAKPIDRQSQVLLCPSEWRPERMPDILTRLPSLSAIPAELIGPAGLAGSTSTVAAETNDLLHCAVCNITVRGVIVACPLCHHGGHMEHMSAWCVRWNAIDAEAICPAPNCDCHCSYLRFVLRPPAVR